MAYGYNCAPWDTYDPAACGETYLGGSDSLVIFARGYGLSGTLEDGAAQGAAINALIAAGNAVLVDGITLTWADPAPVNVESGIANTPQTVATYDRSLDYLDRNVTKQNVEFYNSINAVTGSRIGALLIYERENDRCTYIEGDIFATGGRNFPNADLSKFHLTLAYRSKTDGQIINNVPDGVFA